jgi:MFS-type transporter involved in bile tolerance (Atg22 family)
VAANGRIQASYSAVSVLGPLLAGVVVAILALSSLLLLDALTFIISALSLASIRASFNRLGAPPPEHIGAAIWEGLRYLAGHPILRCLALFGLLLNFAVATIGAQLVYFAKQHLHTTDAQLGLLYSAQSTGVFVFALAAGRVRRHLRFSQVILGAVIAHGLLTVSFALSPFYWFAVAS